MSSTPAGIPSCEDADLNTPVFTVGRYALRELVGEGASGEVWRADDPRIGRRVAIKLLRIPEGLSVARRAEWEERFLLEARAAGRLSHPGIVSIFDVGTASDGRPFIVMELIEGSSLEVLRRAALPPPLEQVVDLTIQVAEALDAAHRRGVVHRDVKPANILIDHEGRARIADFGIAHLAESELTRSGSFLGSPAFAAPEQIRGGSVDGRADLFSLGAVFYALVTGRRPFEGEDIAAVAYSVCHSDPAPPSALDPSIPRAFDAVILQALAKDPLERFRTGEEMAAALRAAATTASADPDLEGPSIERTAVDEDSAVSVPGVRASLGHAKPDACIRAERRPTHLPTPIFRKAAANTFARIRSAVRTRKAMAWMIAAALVAVLGLALLAGRPDSGQEPRSDRKSFADRLRDLVGAGNGRVSVLVQHGLESGTLEVWADRVSVLRRTLSAPKKQVSGMPFLSYRAAKEEWTIRLTPGDHDLVIAVTGKDGNQLRGKVRARVETKAAYRLEITVRKWPWSKLGLEWGQVGQGGAT